ncbi:hypothetical protein [Nocardia aurantiaca]|uniref:Uncharacterized protein n=1 Tax=Nocardia aurantiaca TaxID=2675850 RepID=A0A6I3KQA2_9NOCA|nr:hypothetical protein [Nocardia aurantiaca]MTE12052.1 hypothetical protein [Nocardia aurantiaca]
MATLRIRQLIIGGAATAATALAVMSAAPTASAQVTGLTFGGGLAHINQTYAVTAHVGGTNPGTQVGFWVVDPSGVSAGLGAFPVNSSGDATLQWTPTAVGTYKIIANDDLTVGAAGGMNIGVSVTGVNDVASGSAAKVPLVGGLLSGLLSQLGL